MSEAFEAGRPGFGEQSHDHRMALRTGEPIWLQGESLHLNPASLAVTDGALIGRWLTARWLMRTGASTPALPYLLAQELLGYGLPSAVAVGAPHYIEANILRAVSGRQSTSDPWVGAIRRVRVDGGRRERSTCAWPTGADLPAKLRVDPSLTITRQAGRGAAP